MEEPKNSPAYYKYSVAIDINTHSIVQFLCSWLSDSRKITHVWGLVGHRQQQGGRQSHANLHTTGGQMDTIYLPSASGSQSHANCTRVSVIRRFFRRFFSCYMITSDWQPNRNNLNVTGSQTAKQQCMAGRQSHAKFACASGLYNAKRPVLQAHCKNSYLKVLSSHSNWGVRLDLYDSRLKSRCPAIF